jgi:hypothetical protein
MQSAILGLSMCLVGVDVGWQPLATGGVEYIIQIDPLELSLIRREGAESAVPAEVKDIRRHRIVIGTDKLPRKAPPPERPSGAAFGSFPEAGQPGTSSKIKLPGRPPPDLSKEAATSGKGGGDGGSREAPGGGKPASEIKAPPSGQTEATARWWWTLGLFLGLLGSMGGNLYLGWITWETRARYRALLRRRRRGDQQPAIDGFPEE